VPNVGGGERGRASPTPRVHSARRLCDLQRCGLADMCCQVRYRTVSFSRFTFPNLMPARVPQGRDSMFTRRDQARSLPVVQQSKSSLPHLASFPHPDPPSSTRAARISKTQVWCHRSRRVLAHRIYRRYRTPPAGALEACRHQLLPQQQLNHVQYRALDASMGRYMPVCRKPTILFCNAIRVVGTAPNSTALMYRRN